MMPFVSVQFEMQQEEVTLTLQHFTHHFKDLVGTVIAVAIAAATATVPDTNSY